MGLQRLPARRLAITVWREGAVWILLAATIIGIGPGCREKSSQRPATTPSATVASLVPAATDLIIAMGAGDHLVAVSNYDTVQDKTGNLPRVGDYLSTDWEMLTKLRPHAMIIQLAKERVPQGFTDRAKANEIELTNVVLDRLADVYPVIDALGTATGETQKAATLSAMLRHRLSVLSNRVKAKPRVKTLLVLNEDGTALVGTGNFLDDLLQLAGGENAAASLGSSWPTADKEKLRAIAPEVVIILDPNAHANALEAAKRFWNSMPEIPASRNHRIYVLSESYVLLNGSHVADIAEKIAEILHPHESGMAPAPLSPLPQSSGSNRAEQDNRARADLERP